MIDFADQRLLYLDLIWAFTIVSYAFFALIVYPIFLFTRSRITWTASRIVLLGGVLGAAPIALAYLSMLVGQLLRGSATELVHSVFDRDWSLLWSMVLTGVIVATVYCAIQSTLLRRNDV